VQPAPASAAPSALSLLLQPPVGPELHAFWPALMVTTCPVRSHRSAYCRPFHGRQT
jgi:hypothetical protein